MARKATLQEIETHWSIDDLVDCHLAMNLQDEAEYRASKRRGNK